MNTDWHGFGARIDQGGWQVAQAILAFVGIAAKGQTTAEDIIGWARENMAAYKVPKLVQFVEALPKSGSGKVMWRLLQDQEAASSG